MVMAEATETFVRERVCSLRMCAPAADRRDEEAKIIGAIAGFLSAHDLLEQVGPFVERVIS